MMASLWLQGTACDRLNSQPDLACIAPRNSIFEQGQQVQRHRQKAQPRVQNSSRRSLILLFHLKSMSGRTYPNIRVLRDVQRRQAVQSTELLRRAYLYLARSEEAPQRVSRRQSISVARCLVN